MNEQLVAAAETIVEEVGMEEIIREQELVHARRRQTVAQERRHRKATRSQGGAVV